MEIPEAETPSPLMGEGWGGGGKFLCEKGVLLLKAPPNPLPPWGEGLKALFAKFLPDTTAAKKKKAAKDVKISSSQMYDCFRISNLILIGLNL